ncbi:unnamed protein product, partial [Staurois parvus]
RGADWRDGKQPFYTAHSNRAEAVNLLEVPPLSPFFSWCQENVSECFMLIAEQTRFTPKRFLPCFAETQYSPFNMISCGTGSHLCIFTQCVFWKGSGTFWNA